MTINEVYSKLRKHNIKNYYLLITCIVLSVTLITSYALILFSPTVVSVLPKGGDSLKQAKGIFNIAIIGCAMFTIYAASLFFKYKSRETGILLALGANKKQLKNVLFHELLFMSSLSSVVGMMLALPLSYSMWKLFQLFIIDTQEMNYRIGWRGFAFSVIFCLLIIAAIFKMAVDFLKRTNIMDIINEHRKCETIKDVKDWYGIVGCIFIVSGIILGYFVPNFIIKYLNRAPSFLWNVLYMLSFVGIYMTMIYVTVHTRKVKTKKYYKNIISHSMMKFQGRQTVRNMCVISVLIIGGLFASFYTPDQAIGNFRTIDHAPIDYAFYYKLTENQIQKDEIYNLADKYGVNIKSYDEIKSVNLIVDGIDEEWKDDGSIVRTYHEKCKSSQFISESDFNRALGQKIDVQKGHYIFINPEMETDAYHPVSKITNPVNMVAEDFKLQQTIVCNTLVDRYILDDGDYERYAAKLPKSSIENIVLFNVENVDKTYKFAKKLISEIIHRSSEEAAVLKEYDDYLAKEQGKDYYLAKHPKPILKDDSPSLARDWKYYPDFRIINKQGFVKNYAVFLMLFIFISIICFISVAIIAYTRSVTLAINNKQVYDDLKRLGANNSYIKRCTKQQLYKIFAIPTIIGSTVPYIFSFIVFLSNSGRLNIEPSEWMALAINTGLLIVGVLYMYLIYRLSLKKVCKIIEI